MLVRGPLDIPGGGIQIASVLAVISFGGHRPVTSANAFTALAASTSAGNAPVSSDPRRSAGRTRRDADLRVCRGVGYAIAVETKTIALDSSGVTRRLGPIETNGPFRSSTLAWGSPQDVPERESSLGGCYGHSSAYSLSDLRRSRRRLVYRDSVS
jgi:hypothetical protein